MGQQAPDIRKRKPKHKVAPVHRQVSAEEMSKLFARLRLQPTSITVHDGGWITTVIFREPVEHDLLFVTTEKVKLMLYEVRHLSFALVNAATVKGINVIKLHIYLHKKE